MYLPGVFFVWFTFYLMSPLGSPGRTRRSPLVELPSKRYVEAAT